MDCLSHAVRTSGIHVDDRAAPNRSCENSGHDLGDIRQTNDACRLAKLLEVQVSGQTRPRLQTDGLGRVDRVDARQGYVAQDERKDGRGQIDPLRQSACCDNTAVLGLRENVREGMAADRVDRARPTCCCARWCR